MAKRVVSTEVETKEPQYYGLEFGVNTESKIIQ